MKNDNSILLSEASIATSKEVRQGTLLVEDGKIAGIWYRNDGGTTATTSITAPSPKKSSGQGRPKPNS